MPQVAEPELRIFQGRIEQSPHPRTVLVCGEVARANPMARLARNAEFQRAHCGIIQQRFRNRRVAREALLDDRSTRRIRLLPELDGRHTIDGDLGRGIQRPILSRLKLEGQHLGDVEAENAIGQRAVAVVQQQEHRLAVFVGLFPGRSLLLSAKGRRLVRGR